MELEWKCYLNNYLIYVKGTNDINYLQTCDEKCHWQTHVKLIIIVFINLLHLSCDETFVSNKNIIKYI